MKQECGIIRDLMPLYHDNVCSVESRAAVEEHISECNDCREYYKKLSDETEKAVVPEIENRKAESLRAVSRRFKRGVTASVILAAALVLISVICGGIMIIGKDKRANKRTIEYNGGNITVSMKPEGLIATVKGTWYSGSRVKSIFIKDNGKEKLIKIFRLEDTEWDDFATPDSKTYDFTIAFADMDADMVDAVYYYSGALNDEKLKGMEEMPPEELSKALSEMTLLWEK